jgi:hypothetical protein
MFFHHHHFTAFAVHQLAIISFDMIWSSAIVFMISVLFSDFDNT